MRVTQEGTTMTYTIWFTRVDDFALFENNTVKLIQQFGTTSNKIRIKLALHPQYEDGNSKI